ncbi:hypothetical protein HDU76_003320 [Blyttiomyces sp. JEL0837]|nr:hypothetical protein HDU76_003320 [Blyttiomyces sp. JEL0837]
MPYLKSLSLKGNALTGSIPPSIGNLSSLSDLNLSGNFINGSIPQELANLKRLTFLNLAQTQLSGRLEEFLSQMTNLSYFFVSETNITGPLPKSLATLPKIKTIGLWNNYINGSIPEEYGTSRTLSGLYLESNLIMGTLPSTFLNRSDLFLDVSDNCMESSTDAFNQTLYVIKSMICFVVIVSKLALTNPPRFNLGPQKLICDKWASQNKPARTSTPIITPAGQVDQNQPPGEIIVPSTTAQDAITRIITLEVTQSIVGTITHIPPVPSTTSQHSSLQSPSSSTRMWMTILMSSLGGTALLVLAFVFYIHRRDRSKINQENQISPHERSTTEQNNDSVIIVPPASLNATEDTGQMLTPTPISPDHKARNNPNASEAVAVTVWLRDLDLDVVRSRYQNQAGLENDLDSFENGLHGDESPVTPVHQAVILRREVFGEELGRNAQTTYEVQRNLQASRHEESLRDTAPTSNTNLEVQLQRVYGIYNTWGHEHVMEWAGLKRLDPAVVEIFKSYHIDGPLLATLDVHSLKEKCGVEDFRLRAKFIQAVEFLKDSSQSLRNRSTGDDVDGDSLPQYERSADQ